VSPARLLIPLLLTASAFALEPLPEDRGAVGLKQTLRRLASPYRVLHVIAHPDDEDSGTMTYLSRGLGADVTIVSITRGESGANLITDDAFDRLGVLRTLEFRRAAQSYGARLRFTRFADFGYSKTLEETLRNWPQEEVVRDLVRIIREEKPHVVLSRWRGGPQDGHGHHQAAGLLAKQAYAAAGDPQKFPDAGPAWKPLKLYSDNRREDDEWTLTVDSGVYDPLLGRTYAQAARLGMRAHRSQGAGSAIQRPGASVRYYFLEASEVGMADRETSFFDRLDAELPNAVSAAVADAEAVYAVDAPEKGVPALARGLKAARAAGLDDRAALFERAIAQALGLELEFLVEPDEPLTGRFSSFRPYETVATATPGRTLEATARIGREDATIEVSSHDGWQVESLGEGRYRLRAPEQARSSAVHWRRDSVWDMAYGYQGRWGSALPADAVWATATIEVEGQPVTLRAPLEASYIDEQRVQRRRPLAVGPAVSVSLGNPLRVWRKGSGGYDLAVSLESLAAVDGTVRLDAPAGWKVEPEQTGFSFKRAGERRMVSFHVTPPADASGLADVRAVASYGAQESAASFERIHSPGLETAYVSQPAVQQVRAMDVAVADDLRVGYVMGAGDRVPDTVRQFGASLDLLDESALASADLSAYDTILVGIRAYAVRPDLIAHNQRLLEYVEQGGVLVVQYNTPEFDKNFGPYPYKMTSRPEETSEEDSPVRILAPEHPVFTGPNAITEADFDDWVEQRGSKFMVEWDERYQPLVEMNDEGQDPQQGVWLAARHGDGMYVYCALAWYRQLPYAVPGAVRIFANLISLGAEDASWR